MIPVLVIIDQFPWTQPPRGLMSTDSRGAVDAHSLIASRHTHVCRFVITAASVIGDDGDIIAHFIVTIMHGDDVCGFEVASTYPGIVVQQVRPAPWNDTQGREGRIEGRTEGMRKRRPCTAKDASAHGPSRSKC